MFQDTSTLVKMPSQTTLVHMTTELPTLIRDDDDGSLLITVSPNAFKKFSFVLYVILTPLICVLGITVNTTGLCALRRDPKKHQFKFYTYMSFLLVFNLIFLMLGLYESTAEITTMVDYYLGNKLRSFTGILRGCLENMIKHTLSGIIIVMSLERLLSLSFPHYAKSSCLTRRPGLVVLSTFLIPAIYIIPGFTAFRIGMYKDSQNETVYEAFVSPEFAGLLYATMSFETVILHYITPATILVLNIMIAISYARFNSKRQSLKTRRASDAQPNLTAFVLSVAVLYVLISLPSVVSQTLVLADKNLDFYGKHKLTLMTFNNFGNFLARVNGSVEFALYVMVSKHYRQICYSMFCNWGEKKQGTESEQTTSTCTQGSRLEKHTSVFSLSKASLSRE